MSKNRVTACNILIGFLRGRYPGVSTTAEGWSLERTIYKAIHYGIRGTFTVQIRDQSTRTENRLRREIRTVLEDLVAGKNIDSVIATINRLTRRPTSLFLREEGAPRPPRIVYGTGRPLGTVSIGDRKYRVTAGDQGDIGGRQFLYSLIRETIEDGTVERFTICKQCKKLFCWGYKRADYCGDQCRWDFHNQSEARRERRFGRAWIPYDKKRGSRSRKQQRRAQQS